METISGIIEPSSGEDRKLGHHILRSIDSGMVFVLSSRDLHLDVFLRKFVLIVGYRTNIALENGRAEFIVVSLMPGDGHSEAGNFSEKAEGVLKLLEATSFQYGTHALHDASGKMLYALQSDLIKLDNYIDSPVVVKGHPLVDYSHEGGPAHLSVTDVCIPIPSMPARKFDIRLRLNNSTAHAWALTAISDRPVVELIGENLVMDDETVEGGPGTAQFWFWVTTTGTTTLTFKKSRALEPEKATAEIKYLVVSE